MRQRDRALLLVGVLALAATGCELLVDFDRSLIDGGLPGEADGATEAAPGQDAQPSGPETGADTSTPGDDGGGDATTTDAGSDVTVTDAPGDTNVTDTSTSDAHDANVTDTSTIDAHDANVADTNVADTNVADTNVADTNVADTNVADTSVPDANDAGTDAGDDGGDGATVCNTLALPPAVTVADSTQSAPAFNGGPIPSDALFALTADTYYLPDGGASGHAGETRQATLQLSGGNTAQVAVAQGNMTATYVLSTNTITFTPTCGTNAPNGTVGYQIVGDGGTGTQLLITGDLIEVQTFTQR